MIVDVLLFAAARELAGCDRIRIDLTEAKHPNLAELRRAVAREVPALEGILASSRFAVGHEFVAESHVLTGVGEVALIPPVSGG